ncbi:hypothetical protein [Georgenia ruanii]|uniref:hypothetical protein n=1 Tax=Georgenia ruanii TaxID=348442 RepID=UPI00126472A1|nr:hypothetical protein [Georgenia ruanii]
MAIHHKFFTAAATFALLFAASAAASLPAGAATPQCGPHCIQVFSAKFGTPTSPTFVESVFRGHPAAGVPAILARPSSSDPAGDMIVPAAGTVSTFYAAGMVSAAVNSHYGTERAVQIEYAPRGSPTGLCAAVATTAYRNEGLTLQPCRTPGRTVFIIDTADSPATAPTYFPIVIGNTTDFVHPFAMTIQGDPAHKLLPQITIQHLRGNPTNVPRNQLWGSTILN